VDGSAVSALQQFGNYMLAGSNSILDSENCGGSDSTSEFAEVMEKVKILG
jgi:hypothetical protein